MGAVTFASKLGPDGTLAVPQQAVEELGIQPGDEVRVSVEAANGRGASRSQLSRARSAMAHRSPEQVAEAQRRAMDLYRPLRSVPPGKTLADVVSSQWPGSETDEEIEAALRELS